MSDKLTLLWCLCMLFLTQLPLAVPTYTYTPDLVSSIPSPYILLVSFQAPGHYNPLLELSAKLQEVQPRTVVAVTFTTVGDIKLDSLQEYVRKHFPSIDVLELYPDPSLQVLREGHREFGEIFGFLDKALSVTNRVVYNSLRHLLNQNLPVLVIYEEFAPFAGVLASEWKVPAVAITPHLNPSFNFLNRPIGVTSAIGNDWQSPDFLCRLANVGKRLLAKVFSLAVFPRLFEECSQLGIPRYLCLDIEAVASHRRHLLLGINSPPLVVPGPFSLNVQLVGPFIPPPGDEAEWEIMIQKVSETSSGIIYVSMGSDVELSLAQTAVVTAELEKVAQVRNLHVIWARYMNGTLGDINLIRAKEYFEKNGLKAPSARWTLASFAPQKYILSRPEIRLFLSHCGLGGVTESLYYSVPILCFPQGRDQPMNALTVKRVGMPSALSLNVTNEEMQTTLHDTFENYDTIKGNAIKISKVMKMGGGLNRAAQLVDGLIDLGDASLLVDFDSQWNWVQSTNIDVFLALILFFYVAMLSLKCCFGCCSTNKRKKLKPE